PPSCLRPPHPPTPSPYPSLFRSASSVPPAARVSMTREPESAEVTKKMATRAIARADVSGGQGRYSRNSNRAIEASVAAALEREPDQKSTRLNSSHVKSSDAVFCL